MVYPSTRDDFHDLDILTVRRLAFHARYNHHRQTFRLVLHPNGPVPAPHQARRITPDELTDATTG